MNSTTKYFWLICCLPSLALTACEPLLDQSDLESLNQCTEKGLLYFINSDLSKHYNTIFVNEKWFNETKTQSYFDHLWTAERLCELNEGKKIVTFAYLSKGDKIFKHHSRGMHTLFVLFDGQDKPLRWSDITCPFADDIGGISEVILENNYLYAECRTQGSYGALSGHSYGALEVHRINMSSFKNEIIWQQEWDNEKGEVQISSQQYFISEDELSERIRARILKISKKK